MNEQERVEQWLACERCGRVERWLGWSGWVTFPEEW